VVPGGGVVEALPASLEACGWRPRMVSSAEAIPDLVGAAGVHVGLLDLRVCGQPSEHFLARIRDALARGPLGWVAGLGPGQVRLDPLRQLVRDHCHDYVVLPCDDALLATVLGHAGGMARPEEGSELARPVPTADGTIGDSPVMQALYRQLRRAAMTEAPVCIGGETRTGKELAAAAIHRHSARHGAPMVVINCGAIPESLVQSELFGFERGAFTGASQRKRGRFEH